MKFKSILGTLIITAVFLAAPAFANSDIAGFAAINFPMGDEYEENGCSNAKLAAEYIDGCVLQPGETFSFNQAVGPRTKDRGFVIGLSAAQKPDLGSGICREATVLFQAAQNAGMEIVERHSHHPGVSYAAPGNDAAIWWGTEDFRFKNTLGCPIRIITGMDSTSKDHDLWAVIAMQEEYQPVPVTVINHPDIIPGRLIIDKTYIPVDEIAGLYGIRYETKENKGIIDVQVNGHHFFETVGGAWREGNKVLVPISEWTELFGGGLEWVIDKAVLSLSDSEGNPRNAK